MNALEMIWFALALFPFHLTSVLSNVEPFSAKNDQIAKKIVINFTLNSGTTTLAEYENTTAVFEFTAPGQGTLGAAVSRFTSQYQLTKVATFNIYAQATRLAREHGLIPFSTIKARLSPTLTITAEMHDSETPRQAAGRLRKQHGLTTQDAEYLRVLFDVQRRSAHIPSAELDVILPSFAAVLDSPATEDSRAGEQAFLRDTTTAPASLDKTAEHMYEFAYGKYLAPLRTKPIRTLEIGLGCNMGEHFSTGASAHFWPTILPNAEIYIAEFDGVCVDQWEAANPESGIRFLKGDQSDPEALRRWVRESGGAESLDVIIDDGGHSNRQQLNSLMVLFNEALRPGGIYILEDLQVSYRPGYWTDYGENHTTKVLMRILESHILGADVFGDRRPAEVIEAAAPWALHRLKSVECFPEVCVLVKCATQDRCSQAWPQRLYTHTG